MQKNIKKHIESTEHKRKNHRRLALLLTVCSVLVAAGVLWKLVLPGVAWQGEPLCGQEHEHTAACYSDENADTETPEQWAAAFADTELTGIWGDDLIAIARTQIGYQESEKNYAVIDEETLKGYTRYGVWSGDAYIDWNTAFAAFCMQYAGIPEDKVPVDSDLTQWCAELQEAGMFWTVQEAAPQAGTLVVWSEGDDGAEQRIGIVSGIEQREDTVYMNVIEGDYENQVAEHEYNLADISVTGYCELNRAQQIAEKQNGNTKLAAGLSLNTIANITEEEVVNERLAVELMAGRNGASAETGESLYAKVISRYSKANNPDQNVKVYLAIGTLPEGVKIEGFSEGQKQIIWRDEKNTEHVIILTIVDDGNGQSHIEFEQPAGATVEFEVQFSSQNGVMQNGESVEISVDKDKITGMDSPVGENDTIADPITLTWTAKNEWDPVDKKVNNADKNQIKITKENKLSGTLIYSIKANSLNRENYGEIWTKWVTVTDTLTLPAGFNFPDGAKVSSDQTKIVDKDGNTILYFSKLQNGRITSLTKNGRTVTYTVEVPNQYMDGGIPQKEQDSIDLEMKLTADALVLPVNYREKSQAEMNQDVITNHVSVQPVPYKTYDVPRTEDSVTTTPSASPEEVKVVKSADKTEIEAGGVITYTLEVQNTGDIAIQVKDGNGYYKVQDNLSDCLYLTDAQIAALPENMTYDKQKNSIAWIPSKTNIKPGEKISAKFAVTVKTAEDDAMKGMQDGSRISNQASYKSKYSNWVHITYKKAKINISKDGKDENGDGKAQNGEKITYTITVNNNTNVDATVDEILSDELPLGLTFQSATIGSQTVKTSGRYLLHGTNTACRTNHWVVFAINGQKMYWNLGIVHAKETIVFQYTCKADTDKLENADSIRNTITGSSGGNAWEDTPVDSPLKLVKSVSQDTNVVYPDGQIFDYQISLSNDREHPSSKDDLEIVDELPSGMLPYGVKLMQNAGGTLKEVSWADYADNKYNNGRYSYTAKIDGRTADVTRNGNRIKLCWSIGRMNAGETVTIHYQTQLHLTDKQKQEGGQYEFTNTVTVDGMNSSVTVHGGTASGSLLLVKTFEGKHMWNPLGSLTEQQKNIQFELTGIDTDGKTVVFADGTTKQTVKLGEFNNVIGSGELQHIFKKLPIGTYTVTETNAELEGKILTTTYTVTDKTHVVEGQENQIKVLHNTQGIMTVDNCYGEGASVDVQKSVYELGTQLMGSPYTKSMLSDKKLFALEEAQNMSNFVIYNVTVVNTGNETVHLDSMQDFVPEGLIYAGMAPDVYGMGAWDTVDSIFGKNTSIRTNQWAGLNNYNSNQLVAGVNITAETTGQTVTWYFDKSERGYNLEKGKGISFLALCMVDDSKVSEGMPLTNKVELSVDEGVAYKDYKEIETKNTPYDLNQNNGSSVDEGTADGKRIISSSVTIMPKNVIVPGIEKEASAYLIPNALEEKALTETSNIPPESAVRWTVTLHNDGTKPLSGYKVEDAVTARFHLMTEKEAGSYKIRSPYVLTIYTIQGNIVNSFDISQDVWKSLADDKQSKCTFDFSDEKYAIPAGGYAKLSVYTNNIVGDYKVYRNTATILPDKEFDANEVKHGELTKDSEGKYVGVTASAEVNALGDYATISWKTIAEKANSENATRGSLSRNYIAVNLDSEYVTYTNNVRNVSGKNFNGFVMVDLMPSLNDTGVINQDDIRGSEFSVDFAGNMKIYVMDKDGNQEKTDAYSIEFSSAKSFTQDDFDGIESENWHETLQAGDRSFRIRMHDDFILKPNTTLIVQYDGRLGADAKPGAIAWNSFGYQYYSESNRMPMKAEPPKVGVLIPKVPSIEKQVIDSTGKEQEYDASKKFTFTLKEKGKLWDKELCEFTICQGGYIEFSDLKDSSGNRIYLENGKEYVVSESESTMPDGYELVGIGEKGGTLGTDFTFIYYENKDITILARNKVDTYQYELPESGGIGTIVYTAGGAIMMLGALLLYGYRLKRKKYNA